MATPGKVEREGMINPALMKTVRVRAERVVLTKIAVLKSVPTAKTAVLAIKRSRSILKIKTEGELPLVFLWSFLPKN